MKYSKKLSPQFFRILRRFYIYNYILQHLTLIVKLFYEIQTLKSERNFCSQFAQHKQAQKSSLPKKAAFCYLSKFQYLHVFLKQLNCVGIFISTVDNEGVHDILFTGNTKDGIGIVFQVVLYSIAVSKL